MKSTVHRSGGVAGTTIDVVRTVVLVVVPIVAGCAPKYHTAAPYRFDPETARAATALAKARCTSGAPLPPRPFVTDGCSLSPDGVWQRCCVEHDMAYWCGGTRAQRAAADEEFRACVARSPGWGVRKIAPLMKLGVRIGGVPWLPFYWRWGYGHPWPRGYRPTSAEEAGRE